MHRVGHRRRGYYAGVVRRMNRRTLLTSLMVGLLAPGRSRVGVAEPKGEFTRSRTQAPVWLGTRLHRVESASTRSFQLPSTSSKTTLSESLYWIVGLGIVLRPGHDPETLLQGVFPTVPSWYASGRSSITLTAPWPTGVGENVTGDGTLAWYWDARDSEEIDPLWKTYALGCVGVWEGRRLSLIWACAQQGNPVVPLLELTSSIHDRWEREPSTFLPKLSDLPVGYLRIDDGPLGEGADG